MKAAVVGFACGVALELWLGIWPALIIIGLVGVVAFVVACILEARS